MALQQSWLGIGGQFVRGFPREGREVWKQFGSPGFGAGQVVVPWALTAPIETRLNAKADSICFSFIGLVIGNEG